MATPKSTHRVGFAFTTNSQRSYSAAGIADSPRTSDRGLRGCTKHSQMTHRGSIRDSTRLHRGLKGDLQRPRKGTTGPQETREEFAEHLCMPYRRLTENSRETCKGSQINRRGSTGDSQETSKEVTEDLEGSEVEDPTPSAQGAAGLIPHQTSAFVYMRIEGVPVPCPSSRGCTSAVGTSSLDLGDPWAAENEGSCHLVPCASVLSVVYRPFRLLLLSPEGQAEGQSPSILCTPPHLPMYKNIHTGCTSSDL